MTAILEVKDLQIAFGGVRAVDGLSFSARREIIAVIGPNGAGKTSAFNCITGFYKPTAGSVRMNGVDTTGKQPADIAAAGVTRTFQTSRLFPDLEQYSTMCALECTCTAVRTGQTRYSSPVQAQRSPVYAGGPPLARLRRFRGCARSTDPEPVVRAAETGRDCQGSRAQGGAAAPRRPRLDSTTQRRGLLALFAASATWARRSCL